MTVDYIAKTRDKVLVTETGCWQFTGYVNPQGYGQVGRNIRTHRLMYEAVRGPIPDGLQLDHLCRNRACCNPDHLEAVTSRVNLVRGIGFAGLNAAKTHCDNGHELNDANTYWRKDRHGRMCIECRRLGLRRYRANHPERNRIWQAEQNARINAYHDRGETCPRPACRHCNPAKRAEARDKQRARRASRTQRVAA